MTETYTLGAMTIGIEGDFIVLTPSSPIAMDELKIYLDPTKLTLPNVKFEVDIAVLDHVSQYAPPRQEVINSEIKIPLVLVTTQAGAIILGNVDMVTGEPVANLPKFRRIRL